MKGNISLKDFITQVSKELREGQATDPDKAFFELTGVSLEVSFSLDTTAKGSGKFIVVDLGAETKATQIHKVVLQLNPLKRANASSPPDPSFHLTGPQFAPPVSSPNGPYFDTPGPINPQQDFPPQRDFPGGKTDFGPGSIK
jgi:hypothetical protein